MAGRNRQLTVERSPGEIRYKPAPNMDQLLLIPILRKKPNKSSGDSISEKIKLKEKAGWGTIYFQSQTLNLLSKMAKILETIRDGRG